MHCVRTVTDNLYWVGANDHRLTLFENIHPIPQGVSYNAYLLLDEKSVLFDTVDWSACRQLLENLSYLLGEKPLDYLVINHMEPDHGACIEEILLRYPQVQIISTEKAFLLMRQFGFDVDSHPCITVAEGDTFTFGAHTVTFVGAPMVHWPEAMVTFDTTNGVLFSADAFGSFIALDGKLFADEVDFDRDCLDECRRYYTNIVGKYGPQVKAVLDKAAKLDIAMLLPLHGFVWRKDLDYILHKHLLWSTYQPEVRGVLIAYASIYGDTESAANILACRLAEQGVPVTMRDTSVVPLSSIVSDAFKYSHIVLASATYNMGVFICMEQLLHDLAAHKLANRRYAILENGSWSPAAGKGMEQIIEPLHWEKVSDTLTVKSALRPDQVLQLDTLADLLAKDVRRAEEKEEKPAGGKRYVCKVCGYVYEGDTLPEDYKCPLCGAGPQYFVEQQ